jgi:hypothetical protein
MSHAHLPLNPPAGPGEKEKNRQLVYVKRKFGWRPAHAPVGEVVKKGEAKNQINILRSIWYFTGFPRIEGNLG